MEAKLTRGPTRAIAANRSQERSPKRAEANAPVTNVEAPYGSEPAVTRQYSPAGLRTFVALDVLDNAMELCASQVDDAARCIMQMIEMPSDAEGAVSQRRAIQRQIATAILAFDRMADLLRSPNGQAKDRMPATLAADGLAALRRKMAKLSTAFAAFDFAVLLATKYDERLLANTSGAHRVLRQISKGFASEASLTQIVAMLASHTG